MDKYSQNQYISLLAELILSFNLNTNDYPHVVQSLQKQTVRYYLHNYEWQRVEQKLMNDETMLFYAIEEMHKKKQYDECYSIIKRQKLVEHGFNFSHLKFEQNCIYLDNILFSQDEFTYAESYFYGKEQQQDSPYFQLKNYNIQEKDVLFLNNSSDENFKEALQEILESDIVGLDSEFTNSYTKLDSHLGQISILQLSIRNKIFIFDMLTLKKDQVFITFIYQLFYSSSLLKIGHSLSSDVSQMNNSIVFPHPLKFNHYIDLSKIYKTHYPTENKNSLQYMVKQLMNNNFSKFEQCSNWQQRPLRKSQLHYAAGDAFVCIMLYDILLKKYSDLSQFIENSKETLLIINKDQVNKSDSNKYISTQILEVKCVNQDGIKQLIMNQQKIQFLFDDEVLFSRLNYYSQNYQADICSFNVFQRQYVSDLINPNENIKLNTNQIAYYSQSNHQIILSNNIDQYSLIPFCCAFQIEELNNITVQFNQISLIIQFIQQQLNINNSNLS